MAERKRSRLKLRAKKTNSDAGIHGDATKPNKKPITHPMSFKPINTTCDSVLNLGTERQKIDVIHIMDDDDGSVRTCSTANVPETKIDSKLLDLQQKLSKFRLPVCDAWKLDDLPPYIVKTKRTSPSCHTCTKELLPLSRFNIEYLSSKRPDNRWTEDCSEISNYDIDVAVQTEPDSTYKRKKIDDLEADSKRKKMGDDASNITEYTELKNESVINKPANSEDSGFPNNKDKLCPICSATFPQSVNQMEIDSHIASCLSLADDDDIDW